MVDLIVNEVGGVDRDTKSSVHHEYLIVSPPCANSILAEKRCFYDNLRRFAQILCTFMHFLC